MLFQQQWSSAPEEEDVRPWHHQRRSWRSHSRKRRRQERSYWRWQCPLCSGKDWRGWTCLTCGWEWSSSSNGLESPQNLPTLIQAKNQDTEMQNSNPCLTEPTKQTEASPATTLVPKAAPVGARLESVLARQTRARKALEAADKMLTIAKQRMLQANNAVEIAKKKVGPATGLALDVTMLLELFKPHMNSLSMNAADINARIEGDVKVVRIRETRFKECASCEMPPGIQLTQLDMQPETPMTLNLFRICLQGNSEGSRKAERQRDQRGRTQWSDGNTHASCRDRLERTRRDRKNEHCKSGTRPLHAVLNKCEKTMKAEENRSAGSRPDNRLKPLRDDSEFTALEFDSTLGYPGEGPPRVPDFGAMERCGSCDLAPWRVSRGGNAGKCEMVKCRVCAWRICATCHNLETRGEFAPPPPEITHPDRADQMRCCMTVPACTSWKA